MTATTSDSEESGTNDGLQTDIGCLVDKIANYAIAV